MLVDNYRSHPFIIAVPNELFYDGALQACNKTEAYAYIGAKLPRGFLPNPTCPIILREVQGIQQKKGGSPSWFNAEEAAVVAEYVTRLVAHLGPAIAPKIGVVTPYRQQMHTINALLHARGTPQGVRVGTTEEFQGQEREIIIISTVRSNAQAAHDATESSIGFSAARSLQRRDYARIC